MSRTLGVWWWQFALVVAAAALTAWLVQYHGYYRAPLAEQAMHPDHAVLRSSGRLGLPLGVAGLSLFVVNLSYLVRRRMLRGGWLGSLRAWLALHVSSGLVGAACILLHSAFHLRSTVGTITSLTLMVVVGTGIMGRYLHSLLPRTIEGRVAGLDDVETRFLALRREVEALGQPFQVPRVTALPVPAGSGLMAVPRMLRVTWQSRQERRRLMDVILHRDLDPATRRQAVKLAGEMVRQKRSLAYYGQLRQIMNSWRFLHRWLAVVMVTGALVHVVVVSRFLGWH